MGDRRELREAETAFGTFWAAYPRKVGKLTASIAFHKALKKTTLPVMLAALAWQGQTRQWQQGIIPNASTWLHQERWNDEGPARVSQPAPPAPLVELAKSIARTRAEDAERGQQQLRAREQELMALGLSEPLAVMQAGREWLKRQ